MEDGGCSWNVSLLNSIFSPYVAMEISKIQIPHSDEQDLIVWAPSSSRAFFVKSCYRVNQAVGRQYDPDYPQALWPSYYTSSLEAFLGYYTYKYQNYEVCPYDK